MYIYVALVTMFTVFTVFGVLACSSVLDLLLYYCCNCIVALSMLLLLWQVHVHVAGSSEDSTLQYTHYILNNCYF